MTRLLTLLLFLLPFCGFAQNFYFGADLSYVNELQDCGVQYKENNVVKDPYQIFADHNCNLVRLRLWHTPAWYDALNQGKRYSDLQDVRKSILRAKTAGQQVLLDFHLSDNWADPSKQRVPNAWLGVVNDLPVLKDSLYNYVFATLSGLAADNLLPEMVQIGNETNKGILLSPQDDAGWTLDWNRNSALFNIAIKAVRDVEANTGKTIKVAIHIAGPADVLWLTQAFWSHGVTDFDIIGISYYWAWHKPTTIAQTGNIIGQLHQLYPGKKAMIFETGYLWTTAWNDNAPNIINESNPAYLPVSPENQRKWLIDLTQEVINKGGIGVIYWEPAWVSSGCWTQWAQGSSQEHATYFDFNNNLLNNGGVGFMEYPYNFPVRTSEIPLSPLLIYVDNNTQTLHVETNAIDYLGHITLQIYDTTGNLLQQVSQNWDGGEKQDYSIRDLSAGVYLVGVYEKGELLMVSKIFVRK